MTDVLEWTPDGLAALADEHTWGAPLLRDVSDAELRARVDASLARYVPCWERGLEATNREGQPRADERGRAAVTHARAWIDATPSPTPPEAASALSLIGARSDGHDSHLAELLVRSHGYAFMVQTLVEMWSLATSYDDPDWPKSEHRLAIWAFGIGTGADPSWVNDSSVSHAKGHLPAFLARRTRAHDAERAELLAAIRTAWSTAPLHARPALAIASDARELAERAMHEIHAANPSWYPHYAHNNLPALIGDRALLDRMGFIKDARPTLRFLERLGTAALPIYESMFTSKITKHQRERLLKQLVNIRGPVTAKLLAPYAEKPPFAADIRAYFTRAPELLALVRKDKKLVAHSAQLDKLATKIGIAPAAKKPAAKKPAPQKPTRSKK